MTEETKQQLYAYGKFFENFKDLEDYANQYLNRESNQDDLDRTFERLKNDIWMNLQIYYPNIKNKELMDLVEKGFLHMSKHIITKFVKNFETDELKSGGRNVSD